MLISISEQEAFLYIILFKTFFLINNKSFLEKQLNKRV